MGDDVLCAPCRVAQGFLDRGELPEAEAAIAAVLESDGAHTEALLLRAALLFLQGNLEECV